MPWYVFPLQMSDLCCCPPSPWCFLPSDQCNKNSGLQALLEAFSLFPWTWSSLRRQIWGPFMRYANFYYTTENQRGTWTWTWWFPKKWSLPTSIFQGAMLVLVSYRLPLIEQTGCSVAKCFTGLERLHFNIDLSQFLGCWGGCCRWDALPE